jgi:hypothetical protein
MSSEQEQLAMARVPIAHAKQSPLPRKPPFPDALLQPPFRKEIPSPSAKFNVFNRPILINMYIQPRKSTNSQWHNPPLRARKCTKANPPTTRKRNSQNGFHWRHEKKGATGSLTDQADDPSSRRCRAPPRGGFQGAPFARKRHGRRSSRSASCPSAWWSSRWRFGRRRR